MSPGKIPSGRIYASDRDGAAEGVWVWVGNIL